MFGMTVYEGKHHFKCPNLQTWIIQNLNSVKLQVQYASDRNTLSNLTNLAQIRQIPSF